MKHAVEMYTNQKVTEQIQLTGGFSFETWLIKLDNNQKIIFRTGMDTEVENGKRFVVSDVFEKENYFYKTVNNVYINRCPEIYLIDKSKEIYHQPYQIMSFVEGDSLDKYLVNADEASIRTIFNQIGRVTAEINNIEINNSQDVFLADNWEQKFEKKLIERFAPLIKDAILTDSEKSILLSRLSKLKAKTTNALLHLDMRLPNLIYHNDEIHVIDAENCEVGDPLYELAIVSVVGMLDENFLAGYRENSIYSIDTDDQLFKYYQLERQAALVNLFKNIINNESLAQSTIIIFDRLKRELIESIKG
jgi:aminoglycoside phosphotransferase (APT) family kinase protein